MADKKEIFSYPYNFVSLGDSNSVERKPYLSSKGKNSGKLICKLINKTPIFTMGKTEKDKEYRDHTIEKFLLENGKYIIPSSSIKGEVRNIVEVLTNSCIKNVEKEQLERRVKVGGKNKEEIFFGIIKEIPDGKKAGEIIEAERIKVDASLLKDEKPDMHKKKYNFSIYNYKKSGIKQEAELRLVSNKKDVEGTLWVTSPIYNKNHKKILSPKKIIVPKIDGKIINFSSKEYDDVDYLIQQRQKRELKNKKEFYLKKLEKGDVIIYNYKNGKAVNLAFSEIPRLRYSLSPLELVPKAFRPCDNIENLCFACRLFGSTGNQEGREDKSKNIACQGKVFFTDATIEKNKANIQSNPVTLKPLGEPHPSLVSFYLNDRDYNDKGASIRGRKFYWHHTDKLKAGKNVKNYLDSLILKGEKPKQAYNSSLQFMNPENTFDFEVRFENLTDEELGVLIYSLELEEGLLHKFGKAKAFGFGSSQILIDKFFLDSEDKYKSFVKSYNEGNKEKYVKIAKEKYVKDSRIEIKELKSILNKDNSLNFKESPFPECSGKIGTKENKINTLNWFAKMKKDKGKEFRLPNILDYSKKK